MIYKFESEILGIGVECKTNELLSSRSSFQIGGPAALTVLPRQKEEMIAVLNAVRRYDIKFVVIGNGSNILFDDSGYDGVVISTTNMREVAVEGTVMRAECGASFIGMSIMAMKNQLTGLEFAYGIPGSCGGAVFMNAGACGSEIAAVIDSVECYNINSGRVVELNRDELDMSYRHSAFMQKDELIILSATLDLAYGDVDSIKKAMVQNKQNREAKQPLDKPNAGSIFKRHEQYAVSKIIDDCGLKGYRIGGAQISEKHAGFIVNCGEATSNDVLELIAHIQKIILKKYGFKPECEIRYIR